MHSKLKNWIFGFLLFVKFFLSQIPLNSSDSYKQLAKNHYKLIISINYKKVNDFQLLHSTATITTSSDYQAIRNLSDFQLKQSVTNPANGDYVTVSINTGKVLNGNTRVYELQRRGFGNFEIPFKYE